MRATAALHRNSNWRLIDSRKSIPVGAQVRFPGLGLSGFAKSRLTKSVAGVTVMNFKSLSTRCSFNSIATVQIYDSFTCRTVFFYLRSGSAQDIFSHSKNSCSLAQAGGNVGLIPGFTT